MKHYLEYLGARIILFVVDRLSLSAAQAVGRGLGRIAYLLMGERRRITWKNIELSGIASSRREIRRIARASFLHLSVMAVESIKGQRMITSDNWKSFVELDIPAETMELLKDPAQGIILVSAHIGNWEAAIQAISFIKPVVGVAKEMSNPLVDRIMHRRRQRANVRPTPKRDADRGRFLAALRNGEILAILADQHARAALGVPIDLFNRPVSMHKSPALLHLVTGTPICFGYCLRTGPMAYKLKAFSPFVHKPSGSKEEDILAVLERMRDFIEDVIREAPEQYLWGHRRWREKHLKALSGDTTSNE